MSNRLVEYDNDAEDFEDVVPEEHAEQILDSEIEKILGGDREQD